MKKVMGLDVGRVRRHERVRKRVIGTQEKPRLSVYRSLKYFYAQLVDDRAHKTLLALSTQRIEKNSKEEKKTASASAVGKRFAGEAKAKGFGRVVFDRGGYLYHGRVKAFAEACRENGLLF